MKQGGLLRTLALVECAAAAGLRVVIGHSFGLTLGIRRPHREEGFGRVPGPGNS